MSEFSFNPLTNNLANNLEDLTSSEPILVTDKQNYAPGETAIIAGNGYAPGFTVNIQIANNYFSTVQRQSYCKQD